jgi:hypothetical protein
MSLISLKFRYRILLGGWTGYPQKLPAEKHVPETYPQKPWRKRKAGMTAGFRQLRCDNQKLVRKSSNNAELPHAKERRHEETADFSEKQ